MRCDLNEFERWPASTDCVVWAMNGLARIILDLGWVWDHDACMCPAVVFEFIEISTPYINYGENLFSRT